MADSTIDQAEAELAAFRDEKDANGDLSHPHLQRLRVWMGCIIEANPQTSLAEAYRLALHFEALVKSQGAQGERTKFWERLAAVYGAPSEPGEVRMRIEQRCHDGTWESVGAAKLTGRERDQIALVLVGLDPEDYDALPASAQARVDENIACGLPPGAALN